MKLRHIWLIVWKEFIQLRRDPLLLRLLFIMPVVQLIVFGYVVSADVTHLPTALVDLDHSAVSRQLDGNFSSSGYFEIKRRPTSEPELRDLIDRGEVAVAIVIPEGSQARLDQGEVAPIGVVVDGSDSQSASVGTSYATRIIAEFNERRINELAGPAPGVDARVRVLYNPTLATVNTMIPGLVASIMMISVMGVMSQAVVKERELGTLEQVLVTPITPGEYVAGKIIPYSVLGAAQSLLVSLLGVWWFAVPFNGSVTIVTLGMALYMLTCVGMGLLISLMSHTRQQAQQMVTFIFIPTFVLSGFVFPIESMPALVIPITKMIPLTWALEVLRGVFVKGAGFGALAIPLIVLAAYAAGLFGVAVALLHRRLSD